jgi:hypothetical protein
MTTAHVEEQLLDLLLDDRCSRKDLFWLDRTNYKRGAGEGRRVVQSDLISSSLPENHKQKCFKVLLTS